MSVQVKDAQLRVSPSYLGKVTGTLSYGDRVEIEQTKGAWNKVSLVEGQQAGWMHESALTKKRIKLKAWASR